MDWDLLKRTKGRGAKSHFGDELELPGLESLCLHRSSLLGKACNLRWEGTSSCCFRDAPGISYYRMMKFSSVKIALNIKQLSIMQISLVAIVE